MELLAALLLIVVIVIFFARLAGRTPSAGGGRTFHWPVFQPGKHGENRVQHILSRLPEEYRVLYDLMLPTASGRTTQIDHVVVSPYGIFVIETKDRTGIIIGNGDSDQWRQNSWGREYSMYNPELQNRTHIGSIRRLLPNTNPNAFYSIVVFTHDSTLNVRNAKGHVIQTSQLLDTILQHQIRVIPDEWVPNIVQILLHNNIEDEELRRQHRASVREAAEIHEQRKEQGFCPMCGGKLVERKGKYGTFMGCSNYPRCRYTQQL